MTSSYFSLMVIFKFFFCFRKNVMIPMDLLTRAPLVKIPSTNFTTNFASRSFVVSRPTFVSCPSRMSNTLKKYASCYIPYINI